MTTRENPDSILYETRDVQAKPVNPFHLACGRRCVNSLELDMNEARPGLCTLPLIFVNAETGDWDNPEQAAEEWAKYFNGRLPSPAEATALKKEMMKLGQLAQVDWRQRRERARELGRETAGNPRELIKELYLLICREKGLRP